MQHIDKNNKSCFYPYITRKEGIGGLFMEQTNHKSLLVRRLMNKKIIGGAHKPEKSFLRFLKDQHSEREAVLRDYSELVKEGVIVRQKKTGEFHVSLTSDKRKYSQYLQPK